ncbi:LYR motif-containing protein 5 [Oopsacas minuta]|uniref:LYR motif-containing protein 5 n=1 Tax=Oopsacas minuta TaxID=111878 RepID=A0AAV7JBM8_9METZ|nr:LYR motif-containing protein 5 [Oopsacas minuta]
MSSQRRVVLQLYRELLFMGREYPMGFLFFRERLRKVFQKNKTVEDYEQISNLIKRGNFVIKELEAMYKLRKYRTLKKNYYEDS